MNRTYELMFIVRPDMTEEDQDKLVSTLETAVTSSGGKVKTFEKMGKRDVDWVRTKCVSRNPGSDGIKECVTQLTWK